MRYNFDERSICDKNEYIPSKMWPSTCRSSSSPYSKNDNRDILEVDSENCWISVLRIFRFDSLNTSVVMIYNNDTTNLAKNSERRFTVKNKMNRERVEKWYEKK